PPDVEGVPQGRLRRAEKFAERGRQLERRQLDRPHRRAGLCHRLLADRAPARQGGAAHLPAMTSARSSFRALCGEKRREEKSPNPPDETRMSQQGITPDRGNLSQGTEDLRSDDLEAVRRLTDAFRSIKQQLSRIIVGQEAVIEELLISLFSKGHCILEGVPGLAKTLMISTLSRCLSLSFSRIQ